MSLPDYLKAFRRAVEKISDYGFAESIDIREELRASKQAVINAKPHSPYSFPLGPCTSTLGPFTPITDNRFQLPVIRY